MNVTLFFLWLELDVRDGGGGGSPSPEAHFPPELYLFHQILSTQRISVVVDYTDEEK